MPLALIVIGLLLIISGARGTYPQLKQLLISDFTGPHNFIQWIVAIGAVGCLGYIPQLEKFSRVFLGLIVVAMFLAQKGFFNQFSAAINNLGASTGGSSGATAATGTTGQDNAIAGGGLGGALSAIDGATGSSLIGGVVSGILGR